MNAEERAAVIDGLQKVTDVLRSDKRFPLPFGHIDFFPTGIDGPTLAAFVVALEGAGWKQRINFTGGIPGGWLELQGTVKDLPVYIYARADEVCEPVEPQPVIQRTCPALDAVIAEAETGGAE